MEVKRSVGNIDTIEHAFLGQLFVQAVYTLRNHEIGSLIACITDGSNFHFFKVKLPNPDLTPFRLLDVMWVHSVNDLENAIGAISFSLAA